MNDEYEVVKDEEIEHDPLAGTVDPKTGLTYASDDDVKQAIEDTAQEMLDEYHAEMAKKTPEELEERAKAIEEMRATKTAKEKNAIYKRIYPNMPAPYAED